MPVPTADELSENAAFQGLLSVELEVLDSHAAVTRGMDAERLRSHRAEEEALLTQLRTRMRNRSEISEPELNQLAELIGLSLARIQALALRTQTHGTELNRAFPDLQSLDDLTKALLIFDALRRDETAMAVIKRVAVESAGAIDPESACKTKCFLEFLVALTSLMVSTMNRIMACTQLAFPPLVFLCAAIVWIIFAFEADQANDVYTKCIEKCEEVGEVPEEDT